MTGRKLRPDDADGPMNTGKTGMLGKLERQGRLKAAFLHHGGDRRTRGAGGGAFSSGSSAAPDAPYAPYRFQNIFQQY